MVPTMSVTDTQAVGPALREARVRVGLSQEKLARLAGCSTARVTQLERGFRPDVSPALERIWRVLDALADEKGGDRR